MILSDTIMGVDLFERCEQVPIASRDFGRPDKRPNVLNRKLDLGIQNEFGRGRPAPS